MATFGHAGAHIAAVFGSLIKVLEEYLRKRGRWFKTTYGINLHSLNLAACGGIFLDRINKIFLYSLYPEHPVYPV